jgi:hypothetical protein
MIEFCARSGEGIGFEQFMAASKFLGCSSSENVSREILAADTNVFVISLSSSVPVGSHPTTFLIADLGDARIALSRPLPVLVEPAGDQYMAYSFDLDELATGHDESSAIDDMKAMIVDSFFLLKAEQGRLGPLQQQHWNFLSRIVQEVG